MKILRIEEVANGWVVYEPYPEPGVYDSTKTHVFETVEGLQKALPALLGKPAPADGEQAHHQALLNAAVENLNARGLEVKMEVPAPEVDQTERTNPTCHKCKSNEFVIPHRSHGPRHWLCARANCQLDFVV